MATLFRRFATETECPEFQTKFLRAAEEFERLAKLAKDRETDQDAS